MNESFENEIKEYIKSIISIEEDELLDVDVTPLGRVDITIATNGKPGFGKNFLKEKITGYIKKAEIPLFVGFIDVYMIEEAEELGLISERSIEKNKMFDWSDLAASTKNNKVKRTEKKYRTVTFYSYKGSTGKTSSVIRCARALSLTGKNVAIVDMDLEAPSFQYIFKDVIKEESFKDGIVDYFFEKSMSINQIDVSNVCREFYLEKNTSGGKFFIVPATKELSIEYIYKLGRLRLKTIHEEEAAGKFFDSLADIYKLDFVLIDARSGLNQWGAYSVISLSDAIMYTSFPGEENTQGLSKIIKLMERSGIDEYALLLSKAGEDDISKAVEILGLSGDIPVFTVSVQNNGLVLFPEIKEKYDCQSDPFYRSAMFIAGL